MTFAKYTDDGKVIIQPAALILSSLEDEEMLEMHTLTHAIVLLKEDMAVQEKADVAGELIRLSNSLMTEAITQLEDQPAEGTIRIPLEAFEDAGIDGDNLRILVDDGLLIFARDDRGAEPSPRTVEALAGYGISKEHLADLLKELDDGE